MLLAFSSFFFTGGNDQSILSHPNPGELLETGNRIQNYAGARGAQLSQFLINDCFGISAYFIIAFLIVAGMKLMKAYEINLWKWFVSCTALMIWFSITLGFAFGGVLEDSFLYPGGLHGYNVSQWICSQVGASGLILILLVTGILIGVFFTKGTIDVVRKAFRPSLPRRNKEKDENKDSETLSDKQESPAEYQVKNNKETKNEPETFVTEGDYERVRCAIAALMGEKDDYLDVFLDDMVYSDTPIKQNISENLADIYQPLKDFICVYQLGFDQTMNDALVICREHFAEFWGQRLVNVMRALHEVRYSKQTDTDEEAEDDAYASSPFAEDEGYSEDDLYEGLEAGEDDGSECHV